ncbi:MAG: Uma2 family endonuclease [Anaerolineae bacterium]
MSSPCRRPVAGVSPRAFLGLFDALILPAILPGHPATTARGHGRNDGAVDTYLHPTAAQRPPAFHRRAVSPAVRGGCLARGCPDRADPRGHLRHGTDRRRTHSLLPLLGELPAHQCGKRALVSAQNSLQLAFDTEVMPDIAVVGPDVLDRDDRLLPSDVSLIVEIAQSSVRHDRVVKLPLYARSGFPEYWIAVLPKRRLEVYREPDEAAGRYRTMQVFEAGETVSPAACPDVTLDVAAILRVK